MAERQHPTETGPRVAAILKPGERLELPAQAQCVHLWNEVLRMAGHDRHAGPPPGSALEALLDYAERV